MNRKYQFVGFLAEILFQQFLSKNKICSYFFEIHFWPKGGHKSKICHKNPIKWNFVFM